MAENRGFQSRIFALYHHFDWRFLNRGANNESRASCFSSNVIFSVAIDMKRKYAISFLCAEKSRRPNRFRTSAPLCVDYFRSTSYFLVLTTFLFAVFSACCLPRRLRHSSVDFHVRQTCTVDDGPRVSENSGEAFEACAQQKACQVYNF